MQYCSSTKLHLMRSDCPEAANRRAGCKTCLTAGFQTAALSINRTSTSPCEATKCGGPHISKLQVVLICESIIAELGGPTDDKCHQSSTKQSQPPHCVLVPLHTHVPGPLEVFSGASDDLLRPFRCAARRRATIWGTLKPASIETTVCHVHGRRYSVLWIFLECRSRATFSSALQNPHCFNATISTSLLLNKLIGFKV